MIKQNLSEIKKTVFKMAVYVTQHLGARISARLSYSVQEPHLKSLFHF